MMDDYPVIGYGVGKSTTSDTIPREKVVLTVLLSRAKSELLEMFNEGLKEMKRTGEYDKIIGTYVKDGNEAKEEAANLRLLASCKTTGNNCYTVLWMTILLTLISFVLALIGVIFGLFSVSPIKALRVLSTIYVDLIRGIPLMVLAFFIYFGLPGVLGFNIPVFIAGLSH